jgi:hypothetical protein
VDSFFVLALVTGVLALPFIKQRWSLIASYVVGGVLAVYGVATIVPALFDPNHLSGLNYIVGSIFIVVGGGMVGLAWYLYRAKQSNR